MGWVTAKNNVANEISILKKTNGCRILSKKLSGHLSSIAVSDSVKNGGRESGNSMDLLMILDILIVNAVFFSEKRRLLEVDHFWVVKGVMTDRDSTRWT